MLNTLTKLAQKPTDKKIRIIRIIFAVILIAIIYFGWDVTAVNFGLPSELKYGFYIFPLIGLIRGTFDPGLFRKGIWKWVITGLGIIMLLISLILIDDTPLIRESSSVTPVSGEASFSLGSVTQNTTTHQLTLSTDNWFGFFGFILVIMGALLNGKNITTKNERFGEKIKKIRI